VSRRRRCRRTRRRRGPCPTDRGARSAAGPAPTTRPATGRGRRVGHDEMKASRQPCSMSVATRTGRASSARGRDRAVRRQVCAAHGLGDEAADRGPSSLQLVTAGRVAESTPRGSRTRPRRRGRRSPKIDAATEIAVISASLSVHHLVRASRRGRSGCVAARRACQSEVGREHRRRRPGARGAGSCGDVETVSRVDRARPRRAGAGERCNTAYCSARGSSRRVCSRSVGSRR
jgi:hypothetical protein